MLRGTSRMFRLGLSLLVLVGLIIGIRNLLSSRVMADRVAGRLQSLLSVPVRVDEGEIGLVDSSSFGMVRIFEADEQAPGKPWLEVREVQADVSAVSLLRDVVPTCLNLKGLAVEVRFDAQGRLLTRLPAFSGQPTGTVPRLS